MAVAYTMQKTCQCGGREFYGLGRFDAASHKFTLLDNRSDVGNNVWDGGEGYAHMSVLDPRPAVGHPHGYGRCCCFCCCCVCACACSCCSY